MFDFSVADYLLFLFIAIVALSFTLVGVEHQRHGGGARLLRRDVSGNLEMVSAPHWLNAVLRFVSQRLDTFVAVECPTSSPLRAQIWFEARTVSWGVLSSGLVVMLAIPAFFAVIGYFDLSPVLVLTLVVASPAVPLMVALSIVFPLQSMHNQWSLSVFDATLPMRSAPLVGLKVAIALASILVAVAGIYASIWASFDLVVGVDENLARLKPALLDSYHAHSAARLMVSGTFIVVQFATIVACLLSVRMFSILHMSRVVSVFIGVFLYLLAFIFANVAGFISLAVIEAHVWAIVVTLFCTMLTVYYKAWQDWTLSAANIGWVGALALASVVVHVAFVTGLGEHDDNIGVLEYLSYALALVPVTAIALAPWSVDLLRHR